MIQQLDTENADLDLTTAVSCLTHTPDASNPRLCQALVYLGDGVKNLDGTGGNFSLRVDLGSQVGPVKTTALATSVVRGWLMSDPVLVPANTAVTVRVLSPNPADASVDVIAYLMDMGISQASSIDSVTDPVALTAAYAAAKTAAQPGADGDTLETLSDQMDAVAILARIGLPTIVDTLERQIINGPPV